MRSLYSSNLENKKNNISYYGRRANDYDVGTNINFNWKIQAEKFGYIKWIKNLKGEKVLNRILDLGSGTGLATLPIAELNRNSMICSCDISMEMLKMQRDKLKREGLSNVVLIIGDAENLPFKNEVFDAILTNGVLHHLPDFSKSIDEIARVLRYGGSYYTNEPNSRRTILFKLEERIKIMIIKYLKNVDYDSTFERPIDPYEVKNRLEDNNFVVGLETHGFLVFARFFPFGFVEAFYNLDKILMKLPYIKFKGEGFIINAEKHDKFPTLSEGIVA